MSTQPARLRRPWRRLAVAFLACLAATLSGFAGNAFAAANTVPRRLSNPLEVRTVPAVAGLEFDFRGVTFVTDSHGSFVIPTSLLPPAIVIPTVGFTVVVNKLHLRPNRSADGVVYRLERFYQRFHTVGPGNRARVVLAALNAYVPVRFEFLDRLGERVDPGLFQSMVVKRIDGAVFKLDRSDVYTGAKMFRASRVVPLTGGLWSKALEYRIQSVLVGGNNVVNRAQQAFTPLRQRSVNVRLLFYSATVSARDRLFGFGVGSGIRLVFPDGTVNHVSFGNGHSVTLRALPRGDYRVAVDTPGLSGEQPLSITRDQVVELRVLSYLDIVVMIGLLFAVGVGLVIVGRLPARRAAPSAEVAPTLVEVAPTLVEANGPVPSTPTVEPSPEVPRERPREPKPAPVGRPPLPQFPPRRGTR